MPMTQPMVWRWKTALPQGYLSPERREGDRVDRYLKLKPVLERMCDRIRNE